MSQLFTTIADCPFCFRPEMTVYMRQPTPSADQASAATPLGCSACFGEFFAALRPVQRPWRMSWRDDLTALLRRT